MAYTKGTLSLLSQTLEGGQKWWNYTTADSIATVMGTGYIADAGDKRMLLGDIVYVSSGTLNTSGLTEGAAAFPFDVGLEGILSGTPVYAELVVSAVVAGAATLVPVSKETVIMPLQLADIAAGTFKIGMPSAFLVTAALFRTVKPASTISKLATLTVGISGVAVTGGVMNLTTANQNTIGGAVAASAITGANVGAAGSTIEVTASAVTAFVEGDGWVEFTVATLGNG